ncbi:COG1669 Predicted nucleotidyltransferases [Burkholderiaceae bacterium]
MMDAENELTLQLTAEELQIVRSILQTLVPEREVWVFGSRATPKHKPYSDLDLVVMGEEALPLVTSADLREAFSDSDLNFKVDLVVWSELTENFKQIIRNHYVVIQDASL